MNKEGKVCILIVNYNGTKDTIECLESLQHINYRNYEVIVVDNASKDPQVLKEYIDKTRYFYLQLEENLGFAGGNNYGIRYALNLIHGIDYFLLLNNDTEVNPDFLTPLVKEIELDSSVGACCSHINYYSQPTETWYGGGDINWIIGYPFHKKHAHMLKKASDENFLTGCVFLFPKHILETVGYLNEDYFLYFEDVAYSIEIKKAGYKLRYVPDSLVYHKVAATTGYQSPLSNYYGTRNNLLFMSKYAQKHTYFMFLFYFILKNCIKYIVYIMKRKRGVRLAITSAFKDFFLQLKGKREHNFYG
ncbi:glycosyltransferase family 2 protein [Bacillus timonensis]|nr:glycosyltransferase family 2 protein [Bacillus timonensis]